MPDHGRGAPSPRPRQPLGEVVLKISKLTEILQPHGDLNAMVLDTCEEGRDSLFAITGIRIDVDAEGDAVQVVILT